MRHSRLGGLESCFSAWQVDFGGPQLTWCLHITTCVNPSLLIHLGICLSEPELSMGWVDPWVGFGRVGSRFCSFRWIALNWVENDKSTVFSDDYTTYVQLQGRASKIQGGMKNWLFWPVFRFISKTLQDTAIVTMEDHALTADSFAVSCIGLGWVHIFRFAMGWLGLGHLVNGLGRVNENGPTDNSVCLPLS